MWNWHTFEKPVMHEILRLVQRKRRKRKSVKASRLAEELEEYKILENLTTKKIRKANGKMKKDLARGEDKNNRFAKYIKSKTKSKTTVGPLVNQDKELTTGEREMSAEFNKFFPSVFTQENLQNIPEPVQEKIRLKMQPVDTTRQQIRNKIGKLGKDAAPGPEASTQAYYRNWEIQS
jgi:hypothetical protein